MKLEQVRVLLTGATGGIGEAIAERLAGEGAALLLTGRRASELERLARVLRERGAQVAIMRADLTHAADRDALAALAGEWQGGVNVVIHNAGRNVSGLFESLDDCQIDDIVATNISAPIQLTRAVLPALQQQREALLLFMGSGFGTLGYPGFAAYSATKFALRGFAEALRREYADTGLRVALLSPRAVDTGLNDSRIRALQTAMNMKVDPPARIADAVAAMIRSPRAERSIGWPERFFARVNRMAPGVVDGALRKQLPIIRSRLAYLPTESVRGDS